MMPRFLPRRAATAFDAWATTYEEDARGMIERRGYTYRRLAYEVLCNLRVGQGARVLEVGTGPGTLGVELLAEHPSVELWGVDISHEMAARAADRGVYRGVGRATFGELPFPNQTFDGLLSTFVLHSVKDQARAFLEVQRVLKTGARAVFVDLCPVARDHVVALALGFFHSISRERGAVGRYRPVEQYLRIALEAGLFIRTVEPIGHPRKYMHFLWTVENPKREGLT